MKPRSIKSFQAIATSPSFRLDLDRSNNGTAFFLEIKCDCPGANPLRLLTHTEFGSSSTKYVKVKGDKSPYDGNLVYWGSRMGRHPEISTRVAKLLKTQKGKCAHCGLYFRVNDVMEVDHIKPKSIGGKDSYSNLQLLHLHCHDVKTREDLKEIRKHQRIRHEEMLSQINWKWVDDVLVCI